MCHLVLLHQCWYNHAGDGGGGAASEAIKCPPLVIAAEQGAADVVVILLEGGAESNAVDENGTCALKAACLADDAATVEVSARR